MIYFIYIALFILSFPVLSQFLLVALFLLVECIKNVLKWYYNNDKIMI